MSEVAIFSFGSVLFVMTTWATFSFGMRRMHELQSEDLANSQRISEVRTDGLTEIHVTERLTGEPSPPIMER
jgi:hypothetical protein